MSTNTSNCFLRYEVNAVEKPEYVHINKVNAVKKSEYVHINEVNAVKKLE
jgi:hypothetical protein